MQAWENFLKKQDEELGKETTDKWLRSLKIAHFDACNLYLEAKDSFQAMWFEEHIRPKIKTKFVNNNYHSIKVHLTVTEESVYAKPAKRKKPEVKPETAPLFQSDQLDPAATFENFIPGEVNQIPFKLLQQLPTETASSFNPLYLYGPSGTGKTHLLMALAHAYRAKGVSVIYVRTETFTNHVVDAIRSGNMREFRKAYRNADILIIDDAHEFARRAATQEELFHTFNTLHTARKQIVLAAECHPSQLEEIEARLVSRFEWGISLSLDKLSPEDLKEVLNRRLLQLNVSFPEDVIEFLLQNFKSGPRALIRATEALVLRTDGTLDAEKAKATLKDLIDVENQNAVTPLKIVRSVASHYGITIEDIFGRSQAHEYVLPRQLAMYLCRTELKLPYQKIGKIFTRDHSTVITSIKAVQKREDLSEVISKLVF